MTRTSVSVDFSDLLGEDREGGRPTATESTVVSLDERRARVGQPPPTCMEADLRSFLEWLGEPVTLSAFDPRSGPREAKTFNLPDEIDAAVGWAKTRNEAGNNLYWNPNRLRDGFDGLKARREDVVAARFAYADLDPDLRKMNYEEARAQLAGMAQGRAKDTGASILIDSGNGFQALYRFVEPVPLTADVIADVEGLSRGVASEFSGVGVPDHVQNVDRVLRLPGTVNYASAGKITKGYPSRSRSRVVFLNGPVRTFTETLERFQAATISGNGGAVAPTAPLPLPELVSELSKTVAALDVVARAIRQDGDLSYADWVEEIVMPLHGTFGATILWPSVRLLFGKVTRGLPGYQPGDESKIDDFQRTTGSRRTVASIYALADKIDPSWRNAASVSVARLPSAALPSALREGGALLDMPLPSVAYAIKPYFPLGEFVELHGPHGQFKSTIALYAALSVAAGGAWNRGEVRQGRSVFISLEDRSATLARRVRSWLEGPEFEDSGAGDARRARDEGVRANFWYLGREEAAGLILTFPEYGQSQVRHDVVEQLVDLCKGAVFVVLETAARLHPGAETNEALSVLAAALEEVATRTGACVVLVRHVAKEQARNGAADSYGGRGGGSLADAARSVLSTTRQGDGGNAVVRLVHTKSTHSAPGPDLVWRPVPRGESVYLQAMTGAEEEAAERAALLERIGRAGDAGVTRRDLERGIPQNATREHRREQLRRCLEDLVRRGTVERIERRGTRGPPTDAYRVVP